MKLKTYVVDTTLRDGEQSAGIAFSKEEKIEIALLLDKIGVYQAEVAIPAIGVSEQDTIKEIMRQKKNIKVSAWSLLDEKNIIQAAECGPDIVHISVPVSYVHIYSVMKKNKQWLKSQVTRCIETAKTTGREITIGFEDASRADISFIVSLAVLLEEMGIKRIRYADTVGVLTPDGVCKIVNSLKYYTGLQIELHVHNDFGMAVANSIAGAKEGARFVDCTLMGIGERAGNCDFMKFVKASSEILNTGVKVQDIIIVQQRLCQLIKNHSKQLKENRI